MKNVESETVVLVAEEEEEERENVFRDRERLTWWRVIRKFWS